MNSRFRDFGTSSWKNSVIPERIPAAREFLSTLGIAPDSSPLNLPEFYPLVRSGNPEVRFGGIGRKAAARLLAALEGDADAWAHAEEGLYYLLSFDYGGYEYPESLTAYALLWAAGVLCNSHPWAKWWIYAGSLRAAQLVSNHAPEKLPDDLQTVLENLCRFVAHWNSRNEKIPAGVATEFGRHASLPRISDLVTEGTHLDPATFASRAKLSMSPSVKDEYAEANRAAGKRYLEKMNVVKEHQLIKNVLAGGRNNNSGEMEDLHNNILVLRAHMERRHDYGDVIDWDTFLDGDIESRVSLNHFQHIFAASLDWHREGSEASGRWAVKTWESWFEQSPCPALRDAGRWRTLEVGGRLSYIWPLCAAALMNREDFRERILPKLARWTFMSIPYLVAFCGPPNNWFQIETAGALLALEFFPEYTEYGRLRTMFLERSRWINERMFLPDGMQSECAPGYHVFPWSRVAFSAALVEALGTPMPENLWNKLDAAASPLWKLRLPDGTIPPFSDAGPHLIRADSALRQYANLRNRPDLAATLEPEKFPKEELPEHDTVLEYSMHTVLRTGWEKDAAALAFDGGFFGTNHQHEDKLGFVYFAGGRTLVGDASVYRYGDDEFERYFRGAWGHSLLTMDGLQQASVFRHLAGPPDNAPYAWPLPDPTVGHYSGGERSLVWGVFADGYATRTVGLWSGNDRSADKATFTDDFVHKRVIAFFGKIGIAVIDRLESRSGNRNYHEVERFFHLAPFLDESDHYLAAGELERINNGFILRYEGQTGVRVVSPVPGGEEKRGWCGAIDPVRGYTAMGGENPSHDVGFFSKVNFPATFVTLLNPVPAESDDSASPWGFVRLEDDIILMEVLGTERRVRLLPDGACWE